MGTGNSNMAQLLAHIFFHILATKNNWIECHLSFYSTKDTECSKSRWQSNWTPSDVKLPRFWVEQYLSSTKQVLFLAGPLQRLYHSHLTVCFQKILPSWTHHSSISLQRRWPVSCASTSSGWTPRVSGTWRISQPGWFSSLIGCLLLSTWPSAVDVVAWAF